ERARCPDTSGPECDSTGTTPDPDRTNDLPRGRVDAGHRIVELLCNPDRTCANDDASGCERERDRLDDPALARVDLPKAPVGGVPENPQAAVAEGQVVERLPVVRRVEREPGRDWHRFTYLERRGCGQPTDAEPSARPHAVLPGGDGARERLGAVEQVPVC